MKKQPLIKDKIKAAPPALDGDGGDFASDPVLAEREDLKKYMRVGELLLNAHRPKAAMIEFEKVVDEDGPPFSHATASKGTVSFDAQRRSVRHCVLRKKEKNCIRSSLKFRCFLVPCSKKEDS